VSAKEEAMQQLREFGQPKRDPRAWARRIIVRNESGEKVHPLALQYAREALGLTEREPGCDDA
jgi:hypothetical protein